MSTRLFIGMITFYILAQVMCNVMDGNPMVQGVSTDMTAGTQYSQVTSEDSNQNTANFWTMGASTLSTIGKIVVFDYSMFYEVDPVTGVKTANDWSLIRYLLIAIGIVMIIEFVIVLRQIISK